MKTKDKLPTSPQGGEAIYEIVGKRGGWVSTSKEVYDTAADWNRRIVYAAPAIAQELPVAANPTQSWIADLRRKLAALPSRQIEIAQHIYDSHVSQSAMLDALDTMPVAIERSGVQSVTVFLDSSCAARACEKSIHITRSKS